MGKKLIIVESPGKVKTIKKILGRGYEIKASVGHIRDLGKKGLSVNVENNFEPNYEIIPDKQKVIDDLVKAAGKADQILLAPDPDREGEAISWHLAHCLNIKEDSLCRITFNAITRRAVETAISEPRCIDMNKVNAQQSRRILDRLVGYKLSPYLWKKVCRGLSAGRVQSVAVQLVCEREEEISRFEPQEYFTIEADYKVPDSTDEVRAKLDKIDDKPVKISDQKTADNVVTELKKSEHKITKINRRERKKAPLPPFITSTLQQETARRYGYSPTRTMKLAQQLYEGIDINKSGPIGLITYMRTDSLRVEDEAVDAARNVITENYGEKYLPAKKRVFKTKRKVQDAHEAIRPVDVNITPDSVKSALSSQLYRLYDLIWKRFVASQMVEALFEVQTVEITADNKKLKLQGEKLKFSGFTKVFKDTHEEEETDDEIKRVRRIPDLKEKAILSVIAIENEQHFTQPKPRYTQASLIKTLEEEGVGRPSTYATIVRTIQDRGYVNLIDKKFQATDLGIITDIALHQHFNEVVNVAFTAEMEAELDKVETDSKNWKAVLQEFYHPFEDKINKIEKSITKLQVDTDVKCPECNKIMRVTFSSTGKFLTCSTYPTCKSTKNIPRDYQVFPGYYEDNMVLTLSDELEKVLKELEEEMKNVKVVGECEKCGSEMVEKTGRFGLFAACTGYPKCKNTKAIPKTIGVACPNENCKGDVVIRRSKRGRIFFSCTTYPDCDFVSWERPLDRKCPKCNNYMVAKKSKAGEQAVCSDKECKHKEDLES